MADFQYVIPQFIDVEARVIGPVTVRQFITIVIGAVTIAIEYSLFDISLFIVVAMFTLAVTGAFGFAKVNGAPFHAFVINILASFKRPPVRVWRKEPADFVVVKELSGMHPEEERVERKKLPASHLTELTLVVNTGGKYKEEEQAYWRGEIAQ